MLLFIFTRRIGGVEAMSEGKKCTKCKVFKSYSEFSKRTLSKDGFKNHCKECCKKYNTQNREKINKRQKEYYQQNKETAKKYYKEYYQQNKERIKEYHRNRREINGEYYKEYKRERYHNDPTYRLRHLVSKAVRNALSNNNGSKEGNSTWDALPYTPQQLREHLEAQFEEGMSWDNYGDWHIDHIYPQSKLPYESMDDENLKIAWSLKNLRPLWAAENLTKSNQIIEGAEELLKEIKKDVEDKV